MKLWTPITIHNKFPHHLAAMSRPDCLFYLGQKIFCRSSGSVTCHVFLIANNWICNIRHDVTRYTHQTHTGCHHNRQIQGVSITDTYRVTSTPIRNIQGDTKSSETYKVTVATKFCRRSLLLGILGSDFNTLTQHQVTCMQTQGKSRILMFSYNISLLILGQLILGDSSVEITRKMIKLGRIMIKIRIWDSKLLRMYIWYTHLVRILVS